MADEKNEHGEELSVFDFTMRLTKRCYACGKWFDTPRGGGSCEECENLVCWDCSTRCDHYWLRWCDSHKNTFQHDKWNYPFCEKCVKYIIK